MMQTRSNNVSLLYEQSKFVAPGNGGAYYPNIFNPSNFYMNGTTMGLERKPDPETCNLSGVPRRSGSAADGD